MNDGLNYGTALYSLATEENAEDVIKDELFEIQKVLQETPEVVTLLDSPALDLDTRQAIVSESFNGVHQYVMNFIKLLTQNRKVHLLSKCIFSYNACYDAAHGIEHVTAVTAIQMTDDEIKQLTDSLKKKRGTEIVVENVVDSGILGGVILRFPDSQIDASLLGRLNKARDDLKSITL